MNSGPELLWEPSPERIERATLTRYRDWLGRSRGLRFDGYPDLWQWSVDDIEAFWGSIAEFFDVRFEVPGSAVLGNREMPGAEWFPGARLSYAEHIFRGKRDEDTALFHTSELRELDEWTWGSLRAHVAAIAAGLRALGVGEGDRVGAYMPNIPETIAAFLACASIGAVWSSAAPEFGARRTAAAADSQHHVALMSATQDGSGGGLIGTDHTRSAQYPQRLEALLALLSRHIRFGEASQLLRDAIGSAAFLHQFGQDFPFGRDVDEAHEGNQLHSPYQPR